MKQVSSHTQQKPSCIRVTPVGESTGAALFWPIKTQIRSTNSFGHSVCYIVPWLAFTTQLWMRWNVRVWSHGIAIVVICILSQARSVMSCLERVYTLCCTLLHLFRLFGIPPTACHSCQSSRHWWRRVRSRVQLFTWQEVWRTIWRCKCVQARFVSILALLLMSSVRFGT